MIFIYSYIHIPRLLGLYSLTNLMKLRPGPTNPTDINEASKVIDLPILGYLTYNLFILNQSVIYIYIINSSIHITVYLLSFNFPNFKYLLISFSYLLVCQEMRISK